MHSIHKQKSSGIFLTLNFRFLKYHSINKTSRVIPKYISGKWKNTHMHEKNESIWPRYRFLAPLDVCPTTALT
jgi:hypothetical protein